MPPVSKSSQTPLSARVANLQKLLSLVETYKEGEAERPSAAGGSMDLLDCSDYRALQNAWRKAMKWTDGLDVALSVMLASVASVKSVGDQLWCKILGPASCGKSTLCEALSANKEFVFSKSTIRGFHSGYKSDRSGEEDNSLIAQIKGKTLITKDGDTLLQSPNLGQILSEARDLYDCTSRSHYRNQMGKDYEGIRMTWLLCGTGSLRSIDSSELGQRFLDCVIMEGIDDDLEDEILLRVVNRASRNMAVEADGTPETHNDPDMTACMQLTGGYVGYLRRNATDLLSMVETDDESLHYITRLGKFVAYMRARPSLKQEETTEREFAARLVSQLVRLGKCLAVVLNRDSLDEEVMRRVRKVALDTARGQTLEIVKRLHPCYEGMTTNTVAVCTNKTDEKTRTMLRFLRHIGAIELFEFKLGRGVSGQKRWKLTPKLRQLYETVMTERSYDI